MKGAVEPNNPFEKSMDRSPNIFKVNGVPAYTGPLIRDQAGMMLGTKKELNQKSQLNVDPKSSIIEQQVNQDFSKLARRGLHIGVDNSFSISNSYVGVDYFNALRAVKQAVSVSRI